MCVNSLKEGDSLANGNTLDQIRKNITGYIGQKVTLKADKGRKKVMVKQGVLENTYPSIFVVKIDGEFDAERRICYSYSDVLTSTVELTFNPQKETLEAN